MINTEPQYRFRVSFKDGRRRIFLGWATAGSKYEACDKVHSNVLRIAGPDSAYRDQSMYTARQAYVPRPAYIGRRKYARQCS